MEKTWGHVLVPGWKARNRWPSTFNLNLVSNIWETANQLLSWRLPAAQLKKPTALRVLPPLTVANEPLATL